MMQNVTKKLEHAQPVYDVKNKDIQLPISTKEESQKSRSYTKKTSHKNYFMPDKTLCHFY